MNKVLVKFTRTLMAGQQQARNVIDNWLIKPRSHILVLLKSSQLLHFLPYQILRLKPKETDTPAFAQYSFNSMRLLVVERYAIPRLKPNTREGNT
ncbi:hypothetical protein [Nostoc sp. WHI]|uniref:hypothetical protein n=1 Tax=Nostoc sp. WHI TaxID=2650611 RepID=UPI0018C6186C|nr:hypothetical protein [Nostoc sp. WHI]